MMKGYRDWPLWPERETVQRWNSDIEPFEHSLKTLQYEFKIHHHSGISPDCKFWLPASSSQSIYNHHYETASCTCLVNIWQYHRSCNDNKQWTPRHFDLGFADFVSLLHQPIEIRDLLICIRNWIIEFIEKKAKFVTWAWLLRNSQLVLHKKH